MWNIVPNKQNWVLMCIWKGIGSRVIDTACLWGQKKLLCSDLQKVSIYKPLLSAFIKFKKERRKKKCRDRRKEGRRQKKVSRRNKIKTKENDKRGVRVALYIMKILLHGILYSWEWKQERNYLGEDKGEEKKWHHCKNVLESAQTDKLDYRCQEQIMKLIWSEGKLI